MKSNSNSRASSSLSNKSPIEFESRKRERKRILKDQDGSQFENLDSLQSRSSEHSNHRIEETKSPPPFSRNDYHKRRSYQQVSKFNNGLMGDLSPSQKIKRRRSMKEIKEEDENDHHSDSSSKLKPNKVKVKVKKINDEEVRNFSFSSRAIRAKESHILHVDLPSHSWLIANR